LKMRLTNRHSKAPDNDQIIVRGLAVPSPLGLNTVGVWVRVGRQADPDNVMDIVMVGRELATPDRRRVTPTLTDSSPVTDPRGTVDASVMRWRFGIPAV